MIGVSSMCTSRLSTLMRRAPNRRGGLSSWLGLRAMRGCAAGSSQHRADPGHELAGAERFCDVVVGADREADNGVHLGVTGGQHDDVGVGEDCGVVGTPRCPSTPGSPTSRITTSGSTLTCQGEGTASGRRREQVDFERLALQVARDHVGQWGFVIDYQRPEVLDRWCGIVHRSIVPPDRCAVEVVPGRCGQSLSKLQEFISEQIANRSISPTIRVTELPQTTVVTTDPKNAVTGPTELRLLERQNPR